MDLEPDPADQNETLLSGVPYMYTTDLELSATDLLENPTAAITISLQQVLVNHFTAFCCIEENKRKIKNKKYFSIHNFINFYVFLKIF